jgi:hypothetical protein
MGQTWRLGVSRQDGRGRQGSGPRPHGAADAGRPARRVRRRTSRRIRCHHSPVVGGKVPGHHDAHRGAAMTIRVLDPRVDHDLEPLALAPAVVLDGATIGLRRSVCSTTQGSAPRTSTTISKPCCASTACASSSDVASRTHRGPSRPRCLPSWRWPTPSCPGSETEGAARRAVCTTHSPRSGGAFRPQR